MARYEIRDKLIQSYRLFRQTMVPRFSKTNDRHGSTVRSISDSLPITKWKDNKRECQTKSPLEETNSINPHGSKHDNAGTTYHNKFCNTGRSELETSTYTLSPHNHGLTTGLSLDLSHTPPRLTSGTKREPKW